MHEPMFETISFYCDGGWEIPIWWVCDAEVDCDDESDKSAAQECGKFRSLI